jgi:hypothetical protein
MTGESWKNPWKLATVGTALMVASGLLTGLVVANWSGGGSDRGDKTVVAVGAGAAAPRVNTSATSATVPTQAAIDTCNQSAATQAGQRERAKDAAFAGGGSLYGLNENKKHDEHYRNAYAACMESRGYKG